MALNEKHYTVLRYLKDNKLTVKEIAKKSGLSTDYIYGLCSGKEGGPVQAEFSKELHAVDKHIEERTSRKMLTARELLYSRLLGWVKSVTNTDVGSKTKHRMLIDAINALNKAYPQINIESYTFKQGMTAEEALNEFRRLTGMADKAVIRKRISELEPRGPESLLDGPGPLDSLTEDSQDTVL